MACRIAHLAQCFQEIVDLDKVFRPRRFAKTLDTCELRIAVPALYLAVCLDVSKPVEAVQRIEIVWNITRDFAKYAEIAGEHGHSQCERLHERHPVAFDKRWEKKRARVLQPIVKLIVGTICFFYDHAAQA
ncbi:hypothetical protein WT97_19755 [Burkholderia sp. MSMB1459WGS]|nr:hypothetical protein WT97_19755 [Burkholderia sp. MSMB1459WGS]